jgi:hypothetical protein
MTGCNSNSEGANNVKVYNSTFVSLPGGAGIRFPNDKSTGNEALNNMFLNVGAVDWTYVTKHDYNWFLNSGDQNEAHMETGTVSPYLNVSAGDFHLKTDTTSGATLPAPYNIDPEGNVRGAGGIWDRGAYQFSSDQVSSAPPPPTSLQAFAN